MSRKAIPILKIIVIICILFLVVELGYMFYLRFASEGHVVFFDGINAFSFRGSEIIAVGSNNDNNQSFEKAKLIQYGDRQQKVFEKLYNKGYRGSFLDVAVDDDTFIAVGSYESSEIDYQRKLRRGLIVKYDKDGSVVFENEYQILENSQFTQVKVVEDGYLVVGQSIYRDNTVGSSKDGGAILVKYSKDGRLLWEKSYGDCGTAIYYDLVVVDGFIYTVGRDSDSLGVISKYDGNGNFLTSTNYKYTDEMGFTGIVYSSNYLFVVTGKKMRNRSSLNSVDAAIVQYDLDCSYIDEVLYDSSYYERFYKIICDDNQNLLVIGISKDRSGYSGGLIGKYKSTLEEVDVISYGDHRDDYFTDIQIVENGYLVSGYSAYEDGAYYSKFIRYSDALKVLEVQS